MSKYLLWANLFLALSVAQARPIASPVIVNYELATAQDAQTIIITPGPTQVQKRNIVLRRTLTATYHYRCPHGGHDVRTFIWQALFDVNQSRLRMQALQNIDKWGTILDRDDEFSVYWFHRYCHRDDFFRCTYTVQGYVEGEIHAHGISMELIKDADVPTARPAVIEVCEPKSPAAPFQCPTPSSFKVNICHIDRIDILGAH